MERTQSSGYECWTNTDLFVRIDRMKNSKKEQLADLAINQWMLPNGVTPGLTGYDRVFRGVIPDDVLDAQLAKEKTLGPNWYKKT